MTSNETCVAVCEINGELLVASNQPSPNYAKEYIPKLQAYLNDPKNETYKTLEDEAKNQISEKIIGESMRLDFDKKYDFLIDCGANNLYKLMKDYHESDTDESLKQIIHECSTILSQDAVDPRVHKIASNIMRPLVDTRILASQISQDPQLLQAIHQVRYVEDEIGGKKHAEIKISERLFKTLHLMQDGDKYYVGITKLTCGLCDTALKTFGQAADKNIQLLYAGTHGGAYPGWQMPEWLKSGNLAHNIFRARLNEIRKILQTTPPKKLPRKALEAVPLTKTDRDILDVRLPHEITAAAEKEKSKESSIASSITAQPKEDTRMTSEAAAGGGVDDRKLSWADRVRGNPSTARTSTPCLSQRPTANQAQAKPTRESSSEAKKIVRYFTAANKPSGTAQARAGGGRGAPSRGRQARGMGGRG